jgi:hypothetical protein
MSPKFTQVMGGHPLAVHEAGLMAMGSAKAATLK